MMNEVRTQRLANPWSVLIVDSNAGIRKVLEASLEMEGFKTFEAATGLEAIDLLSKVDMPCAIVLDISVPVADSIEFHHMLESDAKLSKIPVIIHSEESREATSETFRHDCRPIAKRVDLEELRRAVKAVCGLLS